MNLIQFEMPDGSRRVGVVEGSKAIEVAGTTTVRELALAAIEKRRSLAQQVQAVGVAAAHEYASLLSELRVSPPIDHPDPAHCLVSGTGLTHLSSASTRAKMHQKATQTDEELTDTMRMFRWGVDGGRPAPGQLGVQPEWFYKGDGSIVARPGAPVSVPAFAEDVGEEPEIAGLYVVGQDERPYRVGFAVGNELSDHVMERRNYLYLAHSKLRFCAFGPELRVGPLPPHLEGMSRILRDGRVVWEKAFLSGEENMCHTIENLEFHHFKYRQFLRAGDVHVHFFGTATLSFADGFTTQAGDVFEIGIQDFGKALVNQVQREPEPLKPGQVGVL
ncbi:MAG: AraD1 family protein [Chthoniobacterales bacterium]